MSDSSNETGFFTEKPIATGRAVEGRPGCMEYIGNEGQTLSWSGGALPLPELHTTIRIKMNGIGAAEVVGYFCEAGYLGVATKAINPPEWLKKQQASGRSLLTGTEYCLNFGAEVTSL
jgi:hypothetical protein